MPSKDVEPKADVPPHVNYAAPPRISNRGPRYALFAFCLLYALYYAVVATAPLHMPTAAPSPAVSELQQPAHIAASLWIHDNDWLAGAIQLFLVTIAASGLATEIGARRRSRIVAFIAASGLILIIEIVTYQILILASPIVTHVTRVGGGGGRVYFWSLSDYFRYAVWYAPLLVVGVAYFSGALSTTQRSGER